MKIGIFLTCQYPPGSDMVAALEAQYVMTRLARDRGWDAVATGQHYLSEGMRQIQLVPFLARLAAEAGEMTGISGVLLALSGYLFSIGVLSAQTQTIAWMIIFFFASAAASSAYLTVGETFPLEIRALAIAFFYAIGTGVGGIAGPVLLGWLIDTGSRPSVAAGYLLGAALMVAAGAIEWRWGIAAERKSLETISRPLAFID